MNLDNIEFDVNVIDNLFYYKMFKTNKIDDECNEIREAIINDKKKLKILHLINALSRRKFFIIKIAYKYLNLYTQLSFKKRTMNLRIIILKLHKYINYLNENIIKEIKKQQ